jgi:hypothetical protein
MGRRMWYLGLSALALTSAMGGMLLRSASAGGAEQPITVVVTDIRGAFLDANRNGRAERVDRIALSGTLRDLATGDPVGRDFFDCVAMARIDFRKREGTWICTHLLELPGGHIILQGKDPAGVGLNVLAVTGGTGLYRNARGQADQVDFPRRTEFTIHLEP